MSIAKTALGNKLRSFLLWGYPVDKVDNTKIHQQMWQICEVDICGPTVPSFICRVINSHVVTNTPAAQMSS